MSLRVVILGLSITSSWGNGHATNYRALLRALADRGHEVLFLERDVPWYASRRDLPHPPHGRTALYVSLDDLRARFAAELARADMVVVGSYVPEGARVAAWALEVAGGITAFYDIDTPVTVTALERGSCEYLERDLVPRFDLYLSFTGGPILAFLEERLGARRARAFHCFVDPEAYPPLRVERSWDLGYLGTHSADRLPALERLLLEPARARPARRFVVAGAQYPDSIRWPANVSRVEHLPPPQHPAFYAAQTATLNITRADMLRWGWSPSVRLFEAAACTTPVISDRWDGLDTFFRPGAEILVADDARDVLGILDSMDDEGRAAIGGAARARVLAEHTARHRVVQLEALVAEVAAASEPV